MKHARIGLASGWVILGMGLLGLCGCSALTSTTNTAADAAQTVAHGIAVSSRSTTNASVTRPDNAHYARARVFVHSQLAQIKREAAAGGGENIDALANLLGTNDGKAMGHWMQRHYATLFTGQTHPQTLLNQLEARRG